MTVPPGSNPPRGGGSDRPSGGFGPGTFGGDEGWLRDRPSIVGTLTGPPRSLDPRDLEPPSLLRRAHLDGVVVVWGLVVAVLVHLAFPAAIVLGTILMLRGSADAEDAAEEPEKKELAVVETKFVKLGRPFDPRALPNRRVPQRSTAPVRSARSPAKRADQHPREVPPDVDAGPPPPDPVEDLLTRLGTRADALAKLSQQDYAEEGDPDGVLGGTETRETGSIYPGRLRSYFRRGFTVPSQLGDEDLEGLRTRVEIEITLEGRLGVYRIARPSGNAAFDDAVMRRMRQADGAALPEIPEDEREQFLGRRTNIDFRPPR